MNIFVIGTIDNKGGAALVSWELRKKLKEHGHSVHTFVRYKYSNEPDVHLIPRKRWQDWLVKLFANDLMFAWTDYLMETPEFKAADIVHCHNLHSNFFDLVTLKKMSRKKPVVWTIHDLWAITGFASDSVTRAHPNKKRFLLYLWDTTPLLYWFKKHIYNHSIFTVVAVSDWLMKEIRHSILGKKDTVRIYNGVDTTIFKPQPKKEIRRTLGLPEDAKIILVGLKERHVSQKIIDSYDHDKNVYFVSIGNDKQTNNPQHIVLPYADTRSLFATYLNAADIYLHPSFGETFGLVCAESLACGTPVVTYRLEALPEIVEHQKTGYLTNPGDIEGLRAGIEYILNLPKATYTDMSQAGITKVNANFTIEHMYENYIALYKKLI